jgi:allantoinase
VSLIGSTRAVIGDEVRPASIRIVDGTIAEVTDHPPEVDFGDLVVMPGMVDSHVHVNEPGRTHWEGFASATRAAAAGGTTTIVDMPLNSIPPTVSVDALETKRAAAAGALTVDVAFWGGLIPGSGDHVAPLVESGVCGFKSFLIDSGVAEFPPVTPEQLRESLPAMRELGVPALIHAEDPSSVTAIGGDPAEYWSYLSTRPPEAEADAVSLVAGLAGDTGAHLHVLHVSSGDAVEVLAQGPVSLTGETCPHYLTFCAEEIEDGATAFKCAPPIRSTEHREALWAGLVDGSLSMVVSDHSPAPADIKHLDDGDFGKAWGGIGSLQLRLPATWTGAAARGLSFPQLSRWLTQEPARLAGLDRRKGEISVGMDADLVVWDPDGVTEVEGSRLEHRHPITPYEGMRLRGAVVTTILGGITVFDGDGIAPGNGRMLRRDDRSHL